MIPQAAYSFRLDGEPLHASPYGNGHINETFLLVDSAARQYILQRINKSVFRDPAALMRNIAAVTQHLQRSAATSREVLTLVPTKEGGLWLLDDAGEYWRLYIFVSDSICLETATAEVFRESGVAFGRFQRQLADFDAGTLTETIPRFHDTPHRYAALHAAAEQDTRGRAASAARELEFAWQQEAGSGAMVEMLRRGALPLRVTHNDTKLNNVLFDRETRKAVCVIDLDTVMPGLAANDYGDSIRFGASTAVEDERDLGKVSLSLPLFEAYTAGFLSACGESLTKNEVQTLRLGAKLMTLECGIRFLADYLEGDTYFHTAREKHNLDRCRTQFKLVADMEQNWDAMQEIILREAGR